MLSSSRGLVAFKLLAAGVILVVPSSDNVESCVACSMTATLPLEISNGDNRKRTTPLAPSFLYATSVHSAGMHCLIFATKS